MAAHTNPTTHSAFAALGRLRVFAHGERFDVDAYLRTEGALAPSRVWRRGEDDARPEQIHPRSSGLDIFLCEGRPPPLPEQQRIAIAWLSAQRDAIAALVRFPGVETSILALHYSIEVGPGLGGFSLAAARKLSRLALEVGIDPTFYVWLEPAVER